MCYEGGVPRNNRALSHFLAGNIGGTSMTKLVSLAIVGFVAGILCLASPQQAFSQTYRVAQNHAGTFDAGRCFNRCIHRRGLRPASMRIGYCNRRCQ
jgi:hypothetical protein